VAREPLESDDGEVVDQVIENESNGKKKPQDQIHLPTNMQNMEGNTITKPKQQLQQMKNTKKRK